MLRGRIIEMLMCDFMVHTDELLDRFEVSRDTLDAMFKLAEDRFGGILERHGPDLYIPPEARPLTRMIARAFDAYDLSRAGHSAAI